VVAVTPHVLPGFSILGGGAVPALAPARLVGRNPPPPPL